LPSGPSHAVEWVLESREWVAAEWVVSRCSAIVCGVTEEDVRAAY
jgi:hypothetical protein